MVVEDEILKRKGKRTKKIESEIFLKKSQRNLDRKK
jgi:hypothetical protein